MQDHLVIRYTFSTCAHTLRVLLLSNMPSALSFAFLSSFVWSLNYFTLPAKACSLLSSMLHKHAYRQRPAPIILFPPFSFVVLRKKNPTYSNFPFNAIYHFSIVVIENYEKL